MLKLFAGIKLAGEHGENFIKMSQKDILQHINNEHQIYIKYNSNDDWLFNDLIKFVHLLG